MTSLDVSKNIALTSLNCSGNYYDLDDDDELYASVASGYGGSDLEYTKNCIEVLDVSANTLLRILDCSSNKISELDLSKNINLEELNCSYNDLKALDVSKNIALKKLNCSGSQAASGDSIVDEYEDYEYISPDIQSEGGSTTNPIEVLDVSKNIALTELICTENKLTELNVSNNTALITLDCGVN